MSKRPASTAKRPSSPADSRAASSGARPAGTWKRSARTTAQFEAQIAIVQAAMEFERDFVNLMKVEDLSPAQYNVLRILRGAGEAGLTCGEVGGRLIRHDPDVTRLMDRLDRRNLIERMRQSDDRRVVRTRLTQAGLDLLARLDPQVDALHEEQLGHMNAEKLTLLKSLVQEARTRRS